MMDAPSAARSADPERAAELVTALARVRAAIADSAAAAGRDAAEITLIAVTKGFGVQDLELLLGLGVSDIGESRDQEARGKLPTDLADRAVRVHFIGQLQTNKCRSVARYADAVHSVDRPELASALSDAAQRAEREIDVFLQVNLDRYGDSAASPTRGGVVEGVLNALAADVAQRPQLRLRGVMAVAPNGADADRAFAELARISADLQREHPAATAISAGMSGDFPAAIRHGATHVRVGSALLGHRTTGFG
ncbi:hypothetical protein SAMN05892883_3502 [Jatrophihabitans sp. GAS493]|uniref:YggS family pyridoxal phosphate-dependent enzyme n=1 Tax=Jatrophihabitans sp. GAS493 TaxID=1907575 RepID=UPI000BB92E41|nr:YggS family pyridoxal phosphate-dependent enzyme [Jatrophihabitans sp. GAS493]SOD74318.1 hypothetical protein SAMN05892883_3502 [Jatrophihabitans sp. GAS493]